jgi:hypothetical protein
MHTPNIFEIDAVSLVRHPNTIHHYDRDTRLVRLQIPTQSSGSIIVSVPINSNIAPPGYIYIYIIYCISCGQEYTVCCNNIKDSALVQSHV